MVQVTWAKQKFPSNSTKSIFLAGPTPRSKEVQSWRPEALRILKNLGYDGQVYVKYRNPIEILRLQLKKGIYQNLKMVIGEEIMTINWNGYEIN